MSLPMRHIIKVNWIQGFYKLKNVKSAVGYELFNENSVLQIQSWSHCRHFSYLHKNNVLLKFKSQDIVSCSHHPGACKFWGISTVTRTLKTKKFSSEPQGIHESISALQMKTRLQRRKRPALEEEDRKKHGVWHYASF